MGAVAGVEVAEEGCAVVAGAELGGGGSGGEGVG